MTLKAPRLDDRSFDDLLEEALHRIPLYCPEWTDHNLSDPGITLIELFAWMTDIVLYRLNRVPDKHYIKFMELIGMRLREAQPARVPVTFWLVAPQPLNITIPAGTAVATTRTETEPAITFTTDVDAEIQVPTLQYIMTSIERSNQLRDFNDYSERMLKGSLKELLMFESDPPAEGDALYLGFDQDLSNHVLGIEFDVEIAEGAGIDPANPPYVWEVLSNSQGDWKVADLEYDSTAGFNENGLVRLDLPDMYRAKRNELNAYWLRCRLLEPEDDRPLYQKTPRIHTLHVDSWGITVNTSNVSTIRHEMVGRSDGSPSQRFYLAHTPVVPRRPELGEFLVIRHENGEEERWTEVADFADSGKDDLHYTIDSVNGEIHFAPALPQPDGSIRRYGAVPPKNSGIEMNAYRFGGGHQGNVATHALNVLKSALPYIDRVSNQHPAQGGRNTEHLDDLKVRVPGHLRSLGRAVTSEDFEYLAHEAAPGEISRVHCLQPQYSTGGEIQLLVIPHVPFFQGFIAPESLQLGDEVRDKVHEFLDERRLISTQLEVQEPQYIWVQTEVRFHPSAKSDPETVRQSLEDKLYDFLNPLIGGDNGKGWAFGRNLLTADIIAMLLTVPGVDFIRSVRLFPILHERGEFIQEAESQEIVVPADSVVVSFEHNVIVE